MDSTVHVEIHRSQFPDRLQAELADCLRARRINHKFHYESHKQVQRWLALHEAHSPARTDPGVGQIYEDALNCIAEQFADTDAIHVISLGCGGGQKDLQLLRRLANGNRSLNYTPVDVSVGLTLTARDVASDVIASANCHPLVCDLQTADDLADILDSVTPPDARRVILFFGMLPNFEPGDILGKLGQLLRKDDRLLCSANLAPNDDYDAGVRGILPQYDNASTREWLATLPNDLGLGIDPAAIAFTITGCDDEPAVKRIEANCTIPKDQSVQMQAEPILFRTGDRLRLFYSCRYTPTLLAEALQAHELQIADQWIASSNEEGVFQIRRM